MAKPSFKQTLKGPPAVRSWHTITRCAPCVLKRKFGYVKTHFSKLADRERRLVEQKALPANQRHPRAIENLERSVANRQDWLRYSIATLEECLRFSEARFTGELEKIAPTGTGRKRGVTQGKSKAKDTRKLVAYYRGIIPTFLNCRSVASGTSDHNASMEALIVMTKPVVEAMKRKSGREPEEAEQLAWCEIITTAGKFDPTSSNMSQFNTYYNWRARRVTQIRKDADCPPGRQRIKGKIVTRGTIHMDGDDGDTAAFHPSALDDYVESEERRGAVRLALSGLSDEEKVIAAKHLMGSDSLRKIATEMGVTVHHVRKQVDTVKIKLRDVLADFADFSVE